MTAKVGVDLGSRFVKIAIKTTEGITYKLTDTVEFYKNYAVRKNQSVSIDIAKLGIDESAEIVATGYGRNMLQFSNASVVSEIKAHFRGAKEKTGLGDFTLIDIGGQDSKVISATDGYINDFLMNDKCAASTGRFLENACNILQISLDELSQMHDEPVNLSSTCAIFSESEIIGKIAEGYTIEQIGAGVNASTAKRILPLIRKYNCPNIFASGGVAANSALMRFIEEGLGNNAKITVLENSQFNGAFGCLFY